MIKMYLSEINLDFIKMFKIDFVVVVIVKNYFMAENQGIKINFKIFVVKFVRLVVIKVITYLNFQNDLITAAMQVMI